MDCNMVFLAVKLLNMNLQLSTAHQNLTLLSTVHNVSYGSYSFLLLFTCQMESSYSVIVSLV
jgi:hypothetical protein